MVGYAFRTFFSALILGYISCWITPQIELNRNFKLGYLPSRPDIITGIMQSEDPHDSNLLLEAYTKLRDIYSSYHAAMQDFDNGRHKNSSVILHGIYYIFLQYGLLCMQEDLLPGPYSFAMLVMFGVVFFASIFFSRKILWRKHYYYSDVDVTANPPPALSHDSFSSISELHNYLCSEIKRCQQIVSLRSDAAKRHSFCLSHSDHLMLLVGALYAMFICF